MSGRLDGLGENSLVTRIANLKKYITEQKTSQIAGSANLITERVVSGAAYDFQASIEYQTTRAYELTITTRDQTFGRNPFLWHIFWDVVNTPASLGFLQFTDQQVPANGQQKITLYTWGADAPNEPDTLDILIVLYGINISDSFSVVQII